MIIRFITVVTVDVAISRHASAVQREAKPCLTLCAIELHRKDQHTR
jgi:hypothetical protein